MAFMKIDTSEENVKDYVSDGGGKYINTSGMYEVIIKSVIVDTSANGSEFINLWFEYNGQEQPIYQAIRLTNNDGSVNLGQKLFTKLAVVCGAGNGTEIADPVSTMVPMGKDGASIECMVLKDFENMPVFMRVQMEYSIYEGKIQQRKNVRNFFRYEDKASASEIVNGTEAGKQYAIELEYADKVTYNDDLTEEDIKEWKQSLRSGKKEEPAKPKNGFGGKRFGKK